MLKVGNLEKELKMQDDEFTTKYNDMVVEKDRRYKDLEKQN